MLFFFLANGKCSTSSSVFDGLLFNAAAVGTVMLKGQLQAALLPLLLQRDTRADLGFWKGGGRGCGISHTTTTTPRFSLVNEKAALLIRWVGREQHYILLHLRSTTPPPQI